MQFYKEYANKNWPYAPNFGCSGKWFRWNLYPKEPESIGHNTFWGAKMGDNGLRFPPGFGNNRNVLREKPEISLANMLSSDKRLGANPPTPRRKSEAAAHMDGEPIPHLHIGWMRRE